MKHYDEKTIVVEKKLSQVTCDCCGKVASVNGYNVTYQDKDHSYGIGHLSSSSRCYWDHYDKNYSDEVDICHTCASYIIRLIKSGKITRKTCITQE